MDAVDAVIGFCESGQYSGLSSGCGYDDVCRALGEADNVSSRKSSQMMSYPWGEVLIENHSLRQMTFDGLSIEEKSRLYDYIKGKATVEIERIEGYGRYYRLEEVHAGIESVVCLSSDVDSMPCAVAILFPLSVMESLTLSLSKDMMDALRNMSSANRISIQEICSNIIEEHIKNHKK